jgi:hypothetical protein
VLGANAIDKMDLVCAKVVDAWECRRSRSAAISLVGCGVPFQCELQ